MTCGYEFEGMCGKSLLNCKFMDEQGHCTCPEEELMTYKEYKEFIIKLKEEAKK